MVCLDVFKFDPNYLETEEKYKEIKAEILGEGSDDDESGSSGSESDDEDEEAGEPKLLFICRTDTYLVLAVADKPGITDMTETNLVNLRRTIYLTIMNAVSRNDSGLNLVLTLNYS